MNPRKKNKRKTPQTVGEFLNNKNIFMKIGSIAEEDAIVYDNNNKVHEPMHSKYTYKIPYKKGDLPEEENFLYVSPYFFPFPGIDCTPEDGIIDKFSSKIQIIDDNMYESQKEQFNSKLENLQTQYLMHSGDKEVNPSLKWVGGVSQRTTGSLELDDENELAYILLSRYWERWCHLAYLQNTTIQYNPVWNTDRNSSINERTNTSDSGLISDEGSTTTTYDSKILHTLNQSENTSNTGTQKTDTTDSNTQTLDTNKANTGTSTMTNDLTNTTSVDGTNTRTDNLQQFQTHDGTETRTDNLSQATDITKANTQTLNTNDTTTNDLATSDTDKTTVSEKRDLTQNHTGTDETQYNTTDKNVETHDETTTSTDSGKDGSNKTTTNDLTQNVSTGETISEDVTHTGTNTIEKGIDETETTQYGKSTTETTSQSDTTREGYTNKDIFHRHYTDNDDVEKGNGSTTTFNNYNEKLSYDNEKTSTTVYPKTTRTSTDTTTVETPSGEDVVIEEAGRYAFNSTDLSKVSQVKTMTGQRDNNGKDIDGRKITTNTSGNKDKNFVEESYQDNKPQTEEKTGGHTTTYNGTKSENLSMTEHHKVSHDEGAETDTVNNASSYEQHYQSYEDENNKKTFESGISKTASDSGTDTITRSGKDSDTTTYNENNSKQTNTNGTTTTTNTGTTTDATTTTYGKINNTEQTGGRTNTETKTGTDTETKALKDTESGTVDTTTNSTKTGTQTGTVSVDKTGTIKDDGTETQTVKNTGTTENANNWTENTANTGTQTNKEASTTTETQTGTQATENNLNEATTGTVKDDRTIGQTRTDNLSQATTLTGENSDGKTGTDSQANKNTRNTSSNGETSTNHGEWAYGNIGVTMTQQMLQAEVDFWVNYDYLEYVFQDIDKILATQVY